MKKIIYLHGFLSSALSGKSVDTLASCAQLQISAIAPSLPIKVADALQIIERIIQSQNSQITIIGSSLGGYYATWFSQRYDNIKAVLINPAVKVADKIAPYADVDCFNYQTGKLQRMYTDDIMQLRSIEIEKLAYPERCYLLVEQGDELLDYREAVAYYQGAKIEQLADGNHSFSRYCEYLPRIIKFATA